MNNTNPLIPQGSVLEQKNKSRARVKLAVFFVLAAHFVFFGALLMQGCTREETPPPGPETTPPVIETSAPPAELTAPPAAAPTNLIMTPVVEPPMAVPTVTPLAGGQEYTVVKGDSFYSIGKKFNVPMKAIADANPSVDANKLQIGQRLVIPSAAAAASGAAPGATTTNTGTGEITYTVRSGDTLTKIAAEHGTTVKAIYAANNLTTDRIVVGQRLKIPAKASTPAPASTPTPPGR